MISMDMLVVRAFQLAAQLHAAQIRKASLVPDTPYMSHLMEVAGIVMSNGGSSVVVAAALLHDAIEDQGAQTRPLIEERLGADVLALVEECTEPGTGGAQKAPWRERKEGYLEHVRQASPQGLLIACADKVQNARDLRKQVYVYGAEAYVSFTTGKDEKNWFSQAFVQAARQRLAELRSMQPDEPLLNGIDYLLFDLADVLAYLEAH
jgi:(p)ppGpp synthase/HD superfamily hydrolase